MTRPERLVADCREGSKQDSSGRRNQQGAARQGQLEDRSEIGADCRAPPTTSLPICPHNAYIDRVVLDAVQK